MGTQRVAVIGLGPSGAIAIDALAREQAFAIRVFERREAPGGCWLEDAHQPPNLDPDTFASLASRKGDPSLPVPSSLPVRLERAEQSRYTESSVYPYLETNVDSIPMSFSQEPILSERSKISIAKHGEDTPFRHHSVIRKYIESLVNRNGYNSLVSYNTTVELAEKVGSEWRLVLRRNCDTDNKDEWWEERFDAIVVASGHYSVPYIPRIDGLEAFERAQPGSVKHSKMFRGRNEFRGKKVIVVGASVSAADIAYDLVDVARGPVYAVVLGHTMNSYFGDEAFKHPNIATKPSIAGIATSNNKRTVHFIDGTSVSDVDVIIFGTGYTWSLPFLPHVEVRNNRIPGLYQHVVYQKDPTLLFVGAVGAGLTFKIFEWQAVLAARILSGRAALPSLEDQKLWEQDIVRKKGDGPAFTVVFPDFKDYFEKVRELAGDPREGQVGRRLPPFEDLWLEAFMAGHQRRKTWWNAENLRARHRSLEPLRTRL